MLMLFLRSDHDAIPTFTARGLVVEFGHVFVVQDQVGVGPLVDDALFLVGLGKFPGRLTRKSTS